MQRCNELWWLRAFLWLLKSNSLVTRLSLSTSKFGMSMSVFEVRVSDKRDFLLASSQYSSLPLYIDEFIRKILQRLDICFLTVACGAPDAIDNDCTSTGDRCLTCVVCRTSECVAKRAKHSFQPEVVAEKMSSPSCSHLHPQLGLELGRLGGFSRSPTVSYCPCLS